MHTMNKRINIECNRVFHLEGFYDYVWYIQCRYIREIDTDGA